MLPVIKRLMDKEAILIEEEVYEKYKPIVHQIIEDLEKAAWYIEREIKLRKKGL